MPLYEYRCTACDRLTEKRQKFSDPEITDCPFCGGKLERTITAPAVQFKGGGWYADGYGSKKSPAATGAGESGGTAGEGKGGEDKGGQAKGGEAAAKPAAASSESTSSSGSSSTSSASATAPSGGNSSTS